MNWDDVRVGDTVKAEYNDGAIIQGRVENITIPGVRLSRYINIGGLGINLENCTLLEHKRAYRDGDIGVHRSADSGNTHVGIYDRRTGAFYDSVFLGYRSLVFDSTAEAEIIGNIKDYTSRESE